MGTLSHERKCFEPEYFACSRDCWDQGSSRTEVFLWMPNMTIIKLR